jgi:hypothetical protein
MHMTAIDAAIGMQQAGMTKMIGKRLQRLLGYEGASQEFKTLYNLRNAYIHGRSDDKPLLTSDLVSARRLARRAAEGVLRYAHDYPNATRDDMLDGLDGKST